MRSLASIKVVSKLMPIEGKDRIELAIIDGWQVIVKKGEFQEGAKCVYVEIDSVLPERPEFEFLRSKNFRIKTIKMGGVISQGICFGLDILPPGRNYNVGQDVTQILGIKQYEPAMDIQKEPKITASAKAKYPKFLMRMKWFRKAVSISNKKDSRAFPQFIKKTDETRIQNMPTILKDKAPYVCTEKIDGQSGTFCLVKHKFLWTTKYEYIVCSRNLRLWDKDNSSYWKVSDRYKIESVLKDMIGDNEWVAIQGECIAPNVQGNKYEVSEADLYVFNVIYPSGRMGSVEAASIIEKENMKFVPIINSSYVLPDTVSEVLEYAHGQSAIGNTLREGIVFRSQDGSKSFKAVDPLFLLKYDE